ncbi:MAG: Txe/YoeB family addiction module toxin [Bacillota bacterium]
MPKFTFTELAWEEYLSWQASDRSALKRLNALLKEVARTPFEGVGKPEPLRGNFTGLWSRRINQKDRLVYSVEEETIVIYQCRGHYRNK